MNELDRKIREALRQEDAELFESFGGEQSMLEMVADVFRSRHRWLVVITMFWMVVIFVFAIVAGVRFFGADATRDQVMWAAACVICLSAVSLLKTWFWMEMNKNALTREIKRLELQIARLAGRIRD